MTGGSAHLILERPGQSDRRILPAGEIACSWAVGEAGSLSARVPWDAFLNADIDDPLGWWVRYEHATAGAWGGVITDLAYDLTDGTIEIGATDFAALTMGRRTARNYQAVTAPAGSLALRAIADVNRDDPSWLASWEADEDGPMVRIDWRGDELYDVLRRLADASGQEWLIDADRNFQWRSRIGQYRDGTLLTHPHTIVGGSLDRSLEPVINDLLGVAGNKSYRKAASRSVENEESIRRYGRRQGTRVYPQLRSFASLDTRARRDVAVLGTPPSVVTLQVVDLNDVWAELREGDVVWLLLPFANERRRMRILARSLDAEAGTMEIAGPLEVADVPGRSRPVFEVQA